MAEEEAAAPAGESDKIRTAILGGAFDPPTANHMLGAAEVVHSGQADEVIIVPCGPRPDKPRLSNAVDRFVMTQLAVNSSFSADMPVKVSGVEVMEKKALATYDLLCTLRDTQPDHVFMFVIGSDWLQPGTDLRAWTSVDPETGEDIVTGEKLVSEFDFLVIRRPGYEVEDLSAFGPRMKWLEMPDGVNMLEGNLSSTEIRKRTDASFQAEKGIQFIEGLAAPSVVSFVVRSRLYRKKGEAEEAAERLLGIFRSADVNQNGVIDRNEISRMLTSIQPEDWNDERLNVLLNAVDRNHDGRIDYEEFISYVCGTSKDEETAEKSDLRRASVQAESQLTEGGHRAVDRSLQYLCWGTGLALKSFRKRNVAVFGGAFDPPTLSHVMSLAEIVNCGMVDEAVMVPCGPRPDKPQLRKPLTRYTMCQLAVNSSFSHSMPVRVLDLEVFEPKSLATYDALCRLRAKDPSANLTFVIGSDWLQPGSDLRSWTSIDPETGEEIVTGHKLVEEFDFLVIKRPGHEVEDVTSFGPRMKFMEMPHGMKQVEANMSSTEVRGRATLDYRLNSGSLELIDGIVPPAVYNFVKREGIYRPGMSRVWRA